MALVLALAGMAGRTEAQGTVTVNLKFRQELRLAPGGGVEQVLRAHGNPPVERLFSAVSPALLQSLENGARRRTGRPTPSLGSWHRLQVARSADPGRLLAELNALAEVDTAYLAPVAAPPPGWAAVATPDFTASQTYLGAAPGGLEALFSRTQPGADGSGIRLIDVEYDWFLAHEDLQLAGASLGGVCGSFCNDDHGTAVLGVVAGRANEFGVTGVAAGAEIQVITPVEAGTLHYNPAGAIAAAGAALRAGDVLLIEQQAVGPHGEQFFVPVEWDPAVFDAIRVLTQAGVIVVEASGNGNENLDGPDFNGRFDRTRFDSDAIIVGAGSEAHVRSAFSSYGSRVDLQGWGCCVVSTGYGDLFGSSRGTSYTRGFGGTSSAAAMVAAAAAAVQGFLKTRRGTALGPDDLTALLRTTGTPQSGGSSQPIGPFPNLRAALIQLGAQPQRWALTVRGAGAGGGRVASLDGLTPAIACSSTAGVTSGSCSAAYPAGTAVTLTATPGAGSSFSGWGGACSGGDACRVTMSQALTVTAGFGRQPFTLTVAGSGDGNGTVSAAPGGIICHLAAGIGAGVCASAFESGTRVTLTATAAEGSSFTGWSGACTGTDRCVVTVSEARTVTATFTLLPFSLTLTAAGDGNGTVASDPSGIDCVVAAGTTPTPCAAVYPPGTVVTLTATPEEGSVFTGWDGACSGTDNCEVTLSEARAVSAHFQLRLSLVLAGSGSGAGAVTSEPAGIDCTVMEGAAAGSCSTIYTSGAVVTLTPAPAQGSGFGGWSGACTGTGACLLTMSEARSVTVSFVRTTAALIVSGAGTGSGTVAGSAGTPSIDCVVTGGVAAAAGCRAELPIGGSIVLTAAAQPGSLFAGWAGVSCPAGPTCTVTVSGETGLTARFTPEPAAGAAAGVLLGNSHLSAEQQAGLDLAGNRNGRFDVGDYLALLDREALRQ